MSSLRDELGAGAAVPTPYTILLPPGWRRVAPADLWDGDATRSSLAQMKAAGRADLVLQMRGMLAQYRRAAMESKVFEVYLPPTVDGESPAPAVLQVSPFVLPSGTTWDEAIGRLAQGRGAELADFTETRMWVWRRDGRVADSETTMASRDAYFLVPVPEESPRRALLFHFSVLVAPSEEAAAAAETLVVLGDVIMGTMRWRPAPVARG
ncbi:hypothetical protein [Microbacterium sulfonylureivorans]|uniref:hypothetical protein n=1 Tax=Microbacterium sulfonylureivorans TaxID=2486854 RepID=UPI000FD89E3A|nr:hypothetical protein [Microbacterium sulfonylureivorans]